MVVVVKIGGSLAYDSNHLLNLHLVKTIIRGYLGEYSKSVLFVLGGGSMLHDVTDRYRVNDPRAKIDRRIRGYLKIAQIMKERIARLEHRIGIKGLGPSTLFVKDSAARRLVDRLEFLGLHKLDKLPFLTYGGCVLDKSIGVATISSDNIAAYLAVKLHASKLILVTNTNGVIDQEGRTIYSLRASDYKKYAYIRGGMKDKIRRVEDAVNDGIPTYIANGRAIPIHDLDRSEKVTRLVE